MEDFKINITNLKPYFLGKKKHKEYWKALDYYQHMSFHFDGYFLHMPSTQELVQTKITDFGGDNKETNQYFQRLIDMRRPSESDAIKAYRRSIYLPLTQSPCFKVYNSLRKFLNADDFKIDYTKAEKPNSIADGEYLEDYCEKNYPNFDSVKTWFHEYAMKHELVDANALVYVLPRDFEIEENEYYEPVATIVNCKNVLDFKEDEYAVFWIDRYYEYKSGNTMRKGKILGIITKEGYWECKQKSDKQDFEIEQVGKFEMEYLPAFLTGGVPAKIGTDYMLCKSFISPMLPGLDAMARESSDADAEVVQHVYSTMWYYSQQVCNSCMGTGRMNGKGKQSITCTACDGQTVSPKSPYRDLVLKSMNTVDGDNKVPGVPMGYVVKPTDIVKLMAERLLVHQRTALASINHEFLAEAPIVQSGVAKGYDKQELYEFTSSVAKHSINKIIKSVYYFINEFRYKILVPDKEERESMLPRIPIPTQYDLTSETMLEAQIKSANESKADPEIINQMELEYAAKKFPNEIELRDKLKMKKLLDPFPQLTPDEKSSYLLAKTVEPVDIVVSIYLHPFIERAFIEHKDFVSLEYQKQVDIINAYAEDKLKKMDTANKMKEKAKPQVDPKTGLPIKDVIQA